MLVRRLLAAALLLSAVAACSGGDDDAADAAPEPTAAGSDGAFPVTIEHAFGTTEIPEAPERVVTVGYNEQDFALALGVVPVGTREYIAYDYEARPWAQDVLPEASIPVVGAEELNFEAIAALQPDLILAVYSFIDEAGYETLSAIAPTVAQSGDFETGAVPWQEQLRVTGQALGLIDSAEALVDQVEGEFAAAREAHPEFEGKKLALAFFFDASYYILEPTDLRFRFFADLGFVEPDIVGEISQEQLTELGEDVLVVVGATPDDLANDAVFSGLPAVAEGRVANLGLFSDDFGGALGFGSPLSLPYALDVAVPRLAAAIDGDPATEVEPVP